MLMWRSLAGGTPLSRSSSRTIIMRIIPDSNSVLLVSQCTPRFTSIPSKRSGSALRSSVPIREAPRPLLQTPATHPGGGGVPGASIYIYIPKPHPHLHPRRFFQKVSNVLSKPAGSNWRDVSPAMGTGER